MQLRLSFIAAALLLTTGIAAASVPQSEGVAIRSPADLAQAAAPLEARLTKSEVESKAASAAKTAAKQIKADVATLQSLQKQAHPSKAAANKAFADLNSHLKAAGEKFDSLASKYSAHSSRDLVERQAILQPAIKDLNAELKKLLPEIRLLARHLLTNLGLNTVQTIVKQITPGLKKIDTGLFQILTVLGEDLGPGLVDPLLHTVYGLLDGLGLNLNAHDVVEERAPTKASIQAEAAVVFKHAGAQFEADNATFKKLLAQKHVSEKEFAAAIKAFKAHVAAADASVKKLRAEARKAGIHARAQPGDLNTAVTQLVADLNKTLPTVRSLLRKVLRDLELNTVNKIVDGLTPLLTSLIGGVEALLVGLAPTLSALVNPLLALVNGLTKSLGIDLNNNTGHL
ncbi:hypothetical protein OC835_006993 [Tilletia horrida]|nr:hypothetical protein OC835_006993 [Tilletia horrida]